MSAEGLREKLQKFEATIPSHPFIHTLGFTSANEWDLVEKVSSRVASGIWALDLETGTGPDPKVKALGRENITKALTTLEFKDSVDIFVRINPFGTLEFVRDFDLLASLGTRLPSGIVLPKVSRPEEIREVSSKLRDLESKFKDFRPLSIIPIIETAKGLRNIGQIVETCEKEERVGYVAYGEEDLRMDLKVANTEAGDSAMFERRSRFIDYLGGTRLQAIDRVWTKAKDLEGLKKDTRAGLELGYRAKMIISPKQISAVLEGYTLTQDEKEKMERIIESYEGALKAGKGVATLGGNLVERQHYVQALELLGFSFAPSEPSL